MLDGLPVHADLETPPEPTAPTLVTVSLVYHTALILPTLTPVLSTPPDRPLEEPRAPVTREDPVVLPGGEISADLAGDVVQDPAAGAAGVLRAEFAEALITVVAETARGKTLQLDIHVLYEGPVRDIFARGIMNSVVVIGSTLIEAPCGIYLRESTGPVVLILVDLNNGWRMLLS